VKRQLGRRPLAWMLGRPFERPALDPDGRARLAAALRPDIARFRELTGMSFAGWSV
jgi:hypothetical protein